MSAPRSRPRRPDTKRTADTGTPEAAGKTRLLVLDADGVLTDGSLIYGPGGEILQRFCVHDGYAIRCLQAVGIGVAILTGRCSEAVAQRAQTLSITEVIQGAHDKGAALRDLADRSRVDVQEICYVGDDLFDIPAMQLAGWSAAPANARPEVKGAANYVCSSPGGGGAVREVAELILRARGDWPPPGPLPAAARE